MNGLSGLAQSPPGIEWQRTIGGSSTDDAKKVLLTQDGGYLIVGQSGSNVFADKTEANIGGTDFWLVKLNSSGETLWDKTIGGTSSEYAWSGAVATPDGGYLLGSYTLSGIGGHKTEPSRGGLDWWVVRVDSDGNVLWEKTIGGDLDDQLWAIDITSDGSFILGGLSYSDVSGEKSEPSLGGADYWIVCLDSIGNILWDKTIGGDETDAGYTLVMDSLYDILIGGYSRSNNSEYKSEDNILRTDGLRSEDFWAVRLNIPDEVVWDKTIGATNADVMNSITNISNNKFLMGGRSSSSPSVDKTTVHYGSDDYWAVMWNLADAAIEFQVGFGGVEEDKIRKVIKTFEGNYLLCGFSRSGISGNKNSASYGYSDYWIIKIDSLGNEIWQAAFGGNGNDYAYDCLQTTDGGYIIAGYSSSDDSDIKTDPAIGGGDYWIIKLYPDESCPLQTWYADADEDGYGNAADTLSACSLPPGYVANLLDCDDTNALINPGMPELCNGIDDNCSGVADDGIPFFTYYLDSDDDGYGDAASILITCVDTIPIDYVLNDSDCDDTNNLIHPTASEICNGIDDNCSGIADDGIPFYTYYLDGDGDSYGDAVNSLTICEAIAPVNYVSNNLDCNDSNADINPAASEICNGLDDNCNGISDEGIPYYTYYADEDDDGFGNPGSPLLVCIEMPPLGYVIDNNDCDDTNPNIYPGAQEILNGLDDNCNDEIDEGLVSLNAFNLTEIQLYPNPNSGSFVISGSFNADLIFIEVHNLTGQLILNETFPGNSEIEITLPENFAGIAFVTLKTSHGIWRGVVEVVL